MQIVNFKKILSNVRNLWYYIVCVTWTSIKKFFNKGGKLK